MADSPFRRTRLIDEPALVAAEWWHEGMVTGPDPVSRRKAIKVAVLAGVGIAAGAGIIAVALREDDEIEESKDALEVQRQLGWNFGTSSPLSFPGAVRVPLDRTALDTLAVDLTPRQERLRPYYVPTLFQSLTAVPTAPAAGGRLLRLRDEIQPVSTPAARMAFGRGRAMASLLQDAPAGRAFFIDLPGPESVAFAAGMAEQAEPVFLFDNWPHPRGVVASHLTLGSVVYYRPLLLKAAQTRKDTAPPVFVLDRDRLAFYSDGSDRFDNRYLAKVPTAENLKALGVTQVVYVTPDDRRLQELDDLNTDFMGYVNTGMEVRSLAVTDFAPDPTASSQERLVAGAAYDYTYQDSYYGGGARYHYAFWYFYGWGRPIRPYVMFPMRYAVSYRPRIRATYFRAGAGRARPSSFGKVYVTRSRSSGRMVGGRFGRSGSWGRSSGHSGG